MVGAIGGVTLALAAGARRTEHAYARFLAQYPGSDYAIADSADFGFSEQFDLAEIRRVPGVAWATRVTGLVPISARTGTGEVLAPQAIAPFAPHDRGIGRTVDRWKMVDGRRADPDRPDEVVIGFHLARTHDLGVGSTLQVEFIRRDNFLRLAPATLGCLAERVANNPTDGCSGDLLRLEPPDLRMTFRVVGVEASAEEFPPYEGNLGAPVHLTDAFTARYASDLAGADVLFVRLRPGADHQRFLADVAQTNVNATVSVLSVGADHAATVQRSIHVQAVGLAALALLVGIAAAFAIGHGFARQTFLALEDDVATLRALGMTRRQLVATSLLGAGGAAVVGAALASAVAVALSPLAPVGLARDADPDLGVAFDWRVLAFGSAVIVAVALTVATLTTTRIASTLSRRSTRRRLDPAARGITALHLPVPISVGARHALDPGRGRTAVPVRSALTAMALTVATLVAAFVVASSTDHLLASRDLYGWSHDAQIGSQANPPLAASVVEGLESRPGVRAYAAGTVTEIEVRDVRVSAFALDDLRGEISLDLVAGRRPRAEDEIVVGIATIRQIGAKIGDRLLVGIADSRVPMTVVGTAVFPSIASNGQLGRGAQVTFSTLQRVLPDAPRNIVQVDFADGVDVDLERAEIQEAVKPLRVFGPNPPTELASFGRVEDLPTILATVMIAVGTVFLTYALLTSAHRRRRDFAILETLGYRRRQVHATVAAQSTTFAAVSLIVGLPLGLVAGARVWRAIAHELGVPYEPATDTLTIALIVPAVILAANVVALIPAWQAGRTRPAVELSAE